MDRRDLIKGAVLAAGTASLSACQRSAKSDEKRSNLIDRQPSIHWRMVTSWPKSLDILFGGAESICHQVSQMTDGKFINHALCGGRSRSRV